MNKQMEKALTFCFHKHLKQVRKSIKIPYFIHPLRCMERLALWGIDPDDHPDTHCGMCAHDVKEENPETTYEEIEENVGVVGTEIVRDMTFREKLEGEAAKDFQIAKSQHLADFVNKRVESLVAKIADRMVNVEDWFNIDKAYARKYFLRAKGLYMAVFARKDNIVKKYGQNVFDNIVGNINNWRAEFMVFDLFPPTHDAA